jgi:hypothetical protein
MLADKSSDPVGIITAVSQQHCSRLQAGQELGGEPIVVRFARREREPDRHPLLSTTACILLVRPPRELLLASSQSRSTQTRHAPTRLATNDPGARGAGLCTPFIVEKRPIQVRISRALLDIRVIKSSILERKVLRIGDVLCLDGYLAAVDSENPVLVYLSDRYLLELVATIAYLDSELREALKANAGDWEARGVRFVTTQCRGRYSSSDPKVSRRCQSGTVGALFGNSTVP